MSSDFTSGQHGDSQAIVRRMLQLNPELASHYRLLRGGLLILSEDKDQPNTAKGISTNAPVRQMLQEQFHDEGWSNF